MEVRGKLGDPQPIFMKLEIYNYVQDATSHAKFLGAMSTWVVWANSPLLTHESLSFFAYSPGPQVTPRRASLFVVANVVFLGVKRLKFGPL